MAKYNGLTREQYEKEAKSMIAIAEDYLKHGDLEKTEEYLNAAFEAVRCARKATR
jgi:hypothetical protein